MCVVVAGVLFHISVTEWCICLVLFGLILSLELVNTAIEAVVDLVTEDKKPLAKLAKDTAAGAVLIAAVMAAMAGLLIFVPKLVSLLKSKEILDDLVEKGELTVEQGKALNEELKHNIKKTVEENVKNTEKADPVEELDELLEKMTPEQIEALKERLLK